MPFTEALRSRATRAGPLQRQIVVAKSTESGRCVEEQGCRVHYVCTPTTAFRVFSGDYLRFAGDRLAWVDFFKRR